MIAPVTANGELATHKMNKALSPPQLPLFSGNSMRREGRVEGEDGWEGGDEGGMRGGAEASAETKNGATQV